MTEDPVSGKKADRILTRAALFRRYPANVKPVAPKRMLNTDRATLNRVAFNGKQPAGQQDQIDSADLALFDVCELLVTSPLKVVNATGRHLNRLGTDSGFFASTDYSKTQAWARSFMTHHQTPQGIRYNSRKNPARINYALFGTPEAQGAIQVEHRYPLPDHPDLYRLLLSYDVALL
jgi:hypothetical protein